MTTNAIARSPATLAPSRVDVLLCHSTGGSSRASSSSRRFTGTDSSRDLGRRARSADLRDDLLGEELDVVQVGLVQNLQVDALNTGL